MNLRPHAPAGYASATLVEGQNAADPGMGLIQAALAEVPTEQIVGIGGPALPGHEAATRDVIDVRELAQPGAEPLRLQAPEGRAFTDAWVWPRAHLGKDFTFACLDLAALSVVPGGSVWCAVRKSKGADSVAAQLRRTLGDVETVDRTKGYRLMRARRGDRFDVAAASQRLGQRYAITDPVLGDATLRSCPGVFSRRELDAGTKCLLEHVAAAEVDAPGVVLDVGAGVGPIVVFAGRRWPDAELWAVEPNLLAHACLVDNLQAHGLAPRATAVCRAGLGEELVAARGRVDLALVNPPTHLDVDALGNLVGDVLAWLGTTGRALFVVSRADALATPLRRARADGITHTHPRYTVIEVRAQSR